MSAEVIPFPVRLQVATEPKTPCLCNGSGEFTATRIEVPRRTVHLVCAATDHSKENRL